MDSSAVIQDLIEYMYLKRTKEANRIQDHGIQIRTLTVEKENMESEYKKINKIVTDL